MKLFEEIIFYASAVILVIVFLYPLIQIWQDERNRKK